MKIRHIKRRAKRPDFTLTRIGQTAIVVAKSAAAVTRFFGSTKEDDERAAEFFGYEWRGPVHDGPTGAAD